MARRQGAVVWVLGCLALACAAGARGPEAERSGTRAAGLDPTHVRAPEPRFFVAGPGTVAIENAHTGEGAIVRYRHVDGSYDEQALSRIARVMRSRDGTVGPVTPRLVELLAHVHDRLGTAPIRILSGYRSAAYNDGLRALGRKAASASLHTEGMAADIIVPRNRLVPLWHELRALECCGVGLYQSQGFLHLDVGPARFWEAHTSRVDENLSAGNARVFARSNFDRYRLGEVAEITLHAVTAPPLRIAPDAWLEAPSGERFGPMRLAGADGPGDTPCLEADARSRLRFTASQPLRRGTLVLEVCEPRLERTPSVIRTNPIAIG